MPAPLKQCDNSKARPFFAQFRSISSLSKQHPRIEDILTAFAGADVGIRDTRPHSKTNLLHLLGSLEVISTHTVQAERPEIGRQWASKLASVCTQISRHTTNYLDKADCFNDLPDPAVPDFGNMVGGPALDGYATLINRLTCGSISESAYDQAIHELIEAEYACN